MTPPARLAPRAALALLAGLALCRTDGACARTMQQRLEQACAEPIARLCADAGTDSDRINACLASHPKDLSPDCARLVDIAG